MKEEVENALKSLSNKSIEITVKPHEAMQFTQAALNLAHILAILDNIK